MHHSWHQNVRRMALLGMALGLSGCLSLPVDSDPATLTAAEQAYQAGDYEKAREGFEAVLAAAPEHLEARFRLGNIALRGNDLEAARAHYEQVLARAPRHVKARYNLGVVYLSEAEAQFSYYTAMVPEESQHPRLLRLLGALERFAAQDAATPEPLDGLAEMLQPREASR